MNFERAPRLPAKARLTWKISRLRLDESGTEWRATGCKGGRVSIVALPPLPAASSPDGEEAWLATIEARFEAHAFDPTDEEYCPVPTNTPTPEG